MSVLAYFLGLHPIKSHIAPYEIQLSLNNGSVTLMY